MRTLFMFAVLLAFVPHSPAANWALDKQCTVTVDSSYEGYSPAALTDGIQIVMSDDWELAGWACAEQQGEHYIQLTWSAPKIIDTVVIYWARDAGAFRTSTHCVIQSRQGDHWQTLGEISDVKAGAFSAHRLPARVAADALRILQPDGSGPAGRTDLMWVAEVQAWGPPGEGPPSDGAPQAAFELKPGTHEVSFLSTAADNGSCEIMLGGKTVAEVYSPRGAWGQHRLLLQVPTETELLLRGVGTVSIAKLSAQSRGPGGVAGADPIDRMRDMHIDTPLQNAVIVAPIAENLSLLAKRLQSTLREACGVEVPIIAADEAAKAHLGERTVIAIGSALSNPVLEVLYNKGYLYADSAYPGKAGFTVRTVHDPLGAGFNVVTACGSDTAGVTSAVERLCEHLRDAVDGALPRVLDVTLGPPQSASAPPTDDAIASRVKSYLRLRQSGDAPEWALNNFAGYGIRYNRSGDIRWARMYRALMLALIDFWQEKGPWPMEWLWDPYWAWDNCEEAPCFLDAERLRITNFLLELGRTNRVRYAGGLRGTNEISGGHQLDQCLCQFVLGDYFWKYYKHPEAREWLDLVDWRFKTSAKYHRLSHDSNDYNHAGYWFLLRYARISGDWTYVENGQFGRFVSYVQMMLDNLGYRAQNGDAGSPFAGPEPGMHMMASWLYRDGRHKWAIRSRGYSEPGMYVNDIPPAKPEALVGIHRFDVEPTYYRYLTGHDADGELPPAIAPIDMAYDKISLRGDFDPRAEYMLLDGMSRGEHGHDDGNSIIRYTDRERIWLVDMDYIRRAPKWHNSAVVIRDGQASPQPPLARCDRLQDFGPVAMLRSTMPGYTGTDWERNIFWVKGEYFVFIDNFRAREPGDYRLKLIWRTLGETQVQASDLLVKQAGRRNPYAAFRADRDQDDNGIPDGFTATYTNKWGETKALSALDPEVFHSGANSIRMQSDPNGYAVIYAYLPVQGGERYRFHTMCKTDMTAGCSASTTVYWAGEGRQRLPQVKSGGPAVGAQAWAPMDIEDTAPGDARTAQVVIRVSAQGSDTGSGRAWFDDLSLVHIARDGTEQVVWPDDSEPLSHRLFQIKNADGARPHLSSFLQRGHPRKDGYWVNYPYAGPRVKTLQQVADSRLEPGQERAFLNLLYTSDETAPQSFDVTRIGPTVVRVSGSGENAVMGVRGADAQALHVGPLAVDAEMFVLREQTLWAAGLKTATLDGAELFTSPQPANKTLRLPTPVELSHIASAPVGGPLTPPLTAAGIEQVREVEMNGCLNTITKADLDADGTAELITGDASGAVTALTAAGDVLWRSDTGRPVNVVRAADLDADGSVEVLAGGDDQKVHAYTRDGVEMWAHEFEDFHGRDGKVVALEAADLAGNGNVRIVVGTEAWHWYALDGDGQQLWRVAIPHAATTATVADLDADGDMEIVTGHEYYGAGVVYDHTGSVLWRPGGGPGTLAVASADLNGDGNQEALFGTGDGGASLICFDARGARLWTRSLGDEPRAIMCHTVAGATRVIASSDSMYLYALSSDGTELWRRDMGDIVGVLAARGDDIVAGAGDGTVHLLGADGGALAHFPCRAPVKCLTTSSGDMVAGLADGRLLWLRQTPAR